ncbi:MAG TPA: hypothetical protein VMY77_14700 [Chitinophagaceae bacterium]|nr:hypothetical protein [Chitinophagaceae bacterium]
MNCYLRYFVILVFFVALSLKSFCQDDALSRFVNRFDNYQKDNLQEKIFVHSDQDLYITGEIIWFKVYCADAANNKPLDLSKVAYVEIIDKDQQPVLQAKVSLNKGSGNGSLLISHAVLSGNYILRAYTSLMKNFDAEFYFEKNITIINALISENIVQRKAGDSNNYDIKFFPEGGDLVDGIQSKVGFRVTDASGIGIDFKGVIINEKNDTVVRFHPLKFGIGNFNFTPRKNSHYIAIIKPPDNDIITQPLPLIINNGFVINVTNMEGDNIKINVRTNTGDQSAYLIIHSGRKIKIAQTLFFKNGIAELELDRSKLEGGISYITLITAKNQPVCERLIFKRPQQQLIINAHADREQYLPRQKVTVTIAATDELSNLQLADMSVSVFLLDSLQTPYDNIYDYLWLSSGLKGRVESPWYYFAVNNKESNEAVDNLMLAYGWRRFKWEDVLADRKAVLQFLPEYEGHIITGKIIGSTTNSFVENIEGFLSVPGKHFKLYTSKSNANGLMNFYTKDLFASKILVAQVITPDNQVYRLDILSPFSQTFSSNKILSFSASKTLSQSLLKRSISMQVENIYAKQHLNHFRSQQTDTTLFYGKADVRYNLEDYTRFPTIEEVLREYVRELNVTKRKDKFYLTMVNKDENEQVEVKSPAVFLDGVPMFDNGNKITHYNALKVKSLDIIKPKYFLGPATFDGIASFFTYNGDLSGIELDTTATIVDYDALQLKREFYSPTYTGQQQVTGRIPDFRNLLFWSGDIITDKEGKANINFFSSDQPGKYAVVLQGISTNGKAGSKVFTIEVKPQQ